MCCSVFFFLIQHCRKTTFLNDDQTISTTPVKTAFALSEPWNILSNLLVFYRSLRSEAENVFACSYSVRTTIFLQVKYFTLEETERECPRSCLHQEDSSRSLQSVFLSSHQQAGLTNGNLLQRVRFLCGPAGGRMDWVALIGWEQQGSPSSKVTASLVVGRTLACYSLPWTNIRVQNKSRGKQRNNSNKRGVEKQSYFGIF